MGRSPSSSPTSRARRGCCHELGDGLRGGPGRAPPGSAGGVRSATGGVEVDTQGDAFFVAFARAADAVAAAAAQASDALEPGPVRVADRDSTRGAAASSRTRGTSASTSTAPRGSPAAAHGGQVVLSTVGTRARRRTTCCDLGEHRLKDLAERRSGSAQLGDTAVSAAEDALPAPTSPRPATRVRRAGARARGGRVTRSATASGW